MEMWKDDKENKRIKNVDKIKQDSQTLKLWLFQGTSSIQQGSVCRLCCSSDQDIVISSLHSQNFSGELQRCLVLRELHLNKGFYHYFVMNLHSMCLENFLIHAADYSLFTI